MAHRQRINIKLISVFIAALFFLPVSTFAKGRPPKHPLSYESLKNHREYKHWDDLRKSNRRLSVKKIGAIKLKKSTFWNKKPFQFSTPLVVDSMLFIGADADRFYGIDAKKMKKVWRYKTEGPVQAKATFDSDVVYFGDTKGYAYALSASDGREVWKVELDIPILTAPLILGDRAFFVSETGRLIALKKDSGEEIFRTDPLDKNVGFSMRRASNPVWSDGLILFGTATGTLLAYHEDGSLAWVRQLGERQELVSDLDSQPLIDNGQLYVSTADKKVFSLDYKNGGILWSNDEAGGPNDLVLDGGRLFTTGGGVLSALNPLDGNILWQQDFEIPEVSSPAVSNKIVAVISTSEKFYLVDDDTGDIMYERYIRRGSFGDPVFVNDRLYMISNTGVVYAFLVKEKPPKMHKKG